MNAAPMRLLHHAHASLWHWPIFTSVFALQCTIIPQVLVLHLKRFQYTGSLVKIHKWVWLRAL